MKNDILEKVDEVLSKLSLFDADETTKSLIKMYEHIKYVVSNSVFEIVPEGIKKNTLSRMKAAADNTANQANLKSYANSTILEFPLPINARRSKPESSKVIENLKSEAQAVLLSFESKTLELDAQISVLESERHVLENEIESLKQRADTEAKRLDTLVTGEQEKFSDKKASLDQSYSDRLKELDTQVEKFSKDKEAEFSELISAAKTNADKIDQLYNLASKTSVSGFFAKRASDEKSDADIFRILAAIFYVLIPVTLVVLYFIDPDKSLSLEAMARKIAVGLTFVLPALYFSRESQKHRQQQFETQKTGIRTQGFEPFIEKLSDSDATELRKQMVTEWFTDKNKEKEKKEPVIGYSMSKITKLIEAISKLTPSGS